MQIHVAAGTAILFSTCMLHEPLSPATSMPPTSKKARMASDGKRKNESGPVTERFEDGQGEYPLPDEGEGEEQGVQQLENDPMQTDSHDSGGGTASVPLDEAMETPAKPVCAKRLDFGEDNVSIEEEARMKVMGLGNIQKLSLLWENSKRSAAQPVICTGKHAAGPIFLMVNNAPIPCCEEKCGDGGRQWNAVDLTVLAVLSEGFATAPYESKKKQQDTPGKFLSELLIQEDATTGVRCSMMRMYAFEKHRVMGSKGPRCEDRYVDIGVGDSFVMFISDDSFQRTPGHPETAAAVGGNSSSNSKKQAFPHNVPFIPAFSILEVTYASKNAEAFERGSLLKVTNVALSGIGLNSLRTFLPTQLKASTCAEALQRTAVRQGELATVSKDFSEKTCIFWVHVARGAFLSGPYDTAVHVRKGELPVEGRKIPVDPLYSLKGWCTHDPESVVDITETVILRQTNAMAVSVGEGAILPVAGGSDSRAATEGAYDRTPDIEWASTLLAIAADLGALEMLVVVNDWFGMKNTTSNMRGIPVIDSQKLFAAVQFKDMAKTPASSFDCVIVEQCSPVYIFDTGCTHTDNDAEGSGEPQKVWVAVYDHTVAYGNSLGLSAQGQASDQSAAAVIEKALVPPLADLAICRNSIPVSGSRFTFLVGDADSRTAVLSGKLRSDLLSGASRAGMGRGGGAKRVRFGRCVD